MPLEITRIGYQGILEAAQDDPSVKRWLDTRGHKVVLIIEADEIEEERLSKATERFLEDILKQA